eukprot:TRINITY_DN10033_c0_g1_i7.p1 TRINITY_DN10033_c0_g1~~TRINITY_DN10033_c0_g1_i7.p1  ORF type:complete len:572 (+),score=140.81 TRINITY_DN10033_c0_g1_i7:111-1826(+)
MMAGRILALTVVFGAMFSLAKIVDFDDKNPATWGSHAHEETLFKAPRNNSKYPFISFEVTCPDGETTVSYLIFKTTFKRGVGQVHPNNNTIKTARCKSNQDCLPMDDSPARRRRADSTTTSTTQAPNADGKDLLLDVPEGYVCHEASGLMYKEAAVDDVIGGCMECPSTSEEEEENIGPHTMKFSGDFFDRDGYYTLYMESNSDNVFEPDRIQGSSTFRNVDGYLEAALMPERTFYGVLGLFFLFLGLFWMALLAMYYKDLLRVQFWIGGVIFLGMIEMAVSYGDLDYVNTHGYRSYPLMIMAQVLYAAKHTLARLLVLVVSMGYGIVKPRIGNSYKQIVALGLSYFFFATAYGVASALNKTESDEDKTKMMVMIPLAILDSAIIWWIFMSLAHTMKILSLRNNETKLLLYTRFQWALIASVGASVPFMLWEFSQDMRDKAGEEPDWRNQWWRQGFWNLLFFSILVVIMYLWRPTQNNQRYAYSALENGDDEEEEFEVIPNFQQDAMKMRNLQSRNHPSRPDFDEDEDEDLRWVEENIPSVVANADSGFGNLPMDSDEELMHTRFELSKMD